MKRLIGRLGLLVPLLLAPMPLHAADVARPDLTMHPVGFIALLIFVGAYALVICEELIHMPKSKPVMIGGGVIWALIAYVYMTHDLGATIEADAKHLILEFAELMLFLLVAITYVNALEERRVFLVIRAKLLSRGLTYRQLFWLTGFLAFGLSSSIDNLTTALVMGAVVLAVGAGRPVFITLGCINVVVAANAGGVFSPFGDITTLMVWQRGKLEFWEFFRLVIPALVNFGVPAAIMHFAIPKAAPDPVRMDSRLKPGALGAIALFVATIVTAVSFKNFLNLPPATGMMLGLGYLQIYSYFLNRKARRLDDQDLVLDSFKEIARIEWDTMLFFFGIMFAVGGLGVIGYLALASNFLYIDFGPTAANIAVGVLGAAIDNIPLMFAVLTMNPDMSHGQWLLVTLTTGAGGSLVSIGSAAGVALMGLAGNHYTFLKHIRWAWAIALGYVASILTHLWFNAAYM